MATFDVCWFLALFAAVVCCDVQFVVRQRQSPEIDHTALWFCAGILGVGTLYFPWPAVAAVYDAVAQHVPSPSNAMHKPTAFFIVGVILIAYLEALLYVPTQLYRRTSVCTLGQAVALKARVHRRR